MMKFVLTEDCYDSNVIEIGRKLVEYVIKRKKPIYYSDLAARLSFDINPRNLDYPLGIISDACFENGFPPISVMVINKNDQMPGAGFFKCFYPSLSRDEWLVKYIELYKQVVAFRGWKSMLEAFQ